MAVDIREHILAKQESYPAPMQAGSAVTQRQYYNYIGDREYSRRLAYERRFFEFQEMASNCYIVATGVSLFHELMTRAKWTFIPPSGEDGSPLPGSEILADLSRKILMEDPDTPFIRMVRHAGHFKFEGFSLANWWLKEAVHQGRRYTTLADVQIRPAASIEKINLTDDGSVKSFWQRSQKGVRVELGIEDVVYIVDDTVSDQPEGTGIFRQCFPSWWAIQHYDTLLSIGYERDLRGTPMARFPFTERHIALRRMNPNKTDEEISLMVQKEAQPYIDFIKNQKRTTRTGAVVDSAVFHSQDENQRPIMANKYGLELMTGGAVSFKDAREDIIRHYRQMATIMGIEMVFLGSNTVGGWALARDMSDRFGLKIEASMKSVVEAFKEQLLRPIFFFNGWDWDLAPQIVTEFPHTLPPEVQADILTKLKLTRHEEAINTILAGAALPGMPMGSTLDDLMEQPVAPVAPPIEEMPDDDN